VALKIVRKDDPVFVTQLTCCFHSPPGVGKTSLAFTADDSILLDFDNGAHRSKNRGEFWRFDTWSDVLSIPREQFKPFKTVVIDTAGRLLDLLTMDVIEQDAKLGRGGSLTQTGWGVLKGQFTAWNKMLKSYGMDIVLLCHSDEKQVGEVVKERIDVQGGSKNEIYKTADICGRLMISDKVRTLNCNPDETAFGKNPVGWDIKTVPDFDKDPHFLGDLLREAKQALSARTEEQKESAEVLNTWVARADEALTADDFNGLKDQINAAEVSEAVKTVVKKRLQDKGKERGLKIVAKNFVKA
jgi:hypothetical protein